MANTTAAQSALADARSRDDLAIAPPQKASLEGLNYAARPFAPRDAPPPPAPEGADIDLRATDEQHRNKHVLALIDERRAHLDALRALPPPTLLPNAVVATPRVPMHDGRFSFFAFRGTGRAVADALTRTRSATNARAAVDAVLASPFGNDARAEHGPLIAFAHVVPRFTTEWRDVRAALARCPEGAWTEHVLLCAHAVASAQREPEAHALVRDEVVTAFLVPRRALLHPLLVQQLLAVYWESPDVLADCFAALIAAHPVANGGVRVLAEALRTIGTAMQSANNAGAHLPWTSDVTLAFVKRVAAAVEGDLPCNFLYGALAIFVGPYKQRFAALLDLHRTVLLDRMPPFIAIDTLAALCARFTGTGIRELRESLAPITRARLADMVCAWAKRTAMYGVNEDRDVYNAVLNLLENAAKARAMLDDVRATLHATIPLDVEQFDAYQ